MLETTVSKTEKSKLTIQPATRWGSWQNWFWAILISIPPIILLIVLLNNFWRIPILDEVLFIPTVVKVHTGGITLGELWDQNNEHRIFLWRVIALGLAGLGGYNTEKEVLTSFVLGVLTLLTTWRLLYLTTPQTWRKPALFASALLIFSFCQWENWVWGFQMAWFLANFLMLLAILILTYRPVRLRNFILATGLAIAASYTTGSGLPIWPAVGLAMLLDWQHWRWKYLLTWGGTAIAVCVFYEINLRPVDYVPSKTYALEHPIETFIYILNYLGLPVANWNTDQSIQGCLWFGSIFLIVVSLSGSWLWRQRKYSQESAAAWWVSWPWLTMFLVVLLNAVLTAVSRVGLGLAEGLNSSRYSTMSIWFWLAGGVITATAACNLWQLKAHKLKRPRLLLSIIGLLILALAISFGITSTNAYYTWVARAQHNNAAEPFLYEYHTAPSEMLERILTGHSDLMPYFANLLEQAHEGPFAISKQQFQQQQTRQWQAHLKPTQQPQIYPARMAAVVWGNVSNVSVTEQQITFTHSGSKVVETVYDLSKFYQEHNLSSSLEKSVPIEIKTQNSLYVRVYYDVGRGINANDVAILAAAEEKDGYRYFRTDLPPATRQIQMETSYLVSQPLTEQFQLTLYVEH